MTVLVDWQIKRLCENDRMIEPFDSELLNPASLDVRVGCSAKRETVHGWMDVDLTSYSEDSPLLIEPKEFVLISTLEVFNLPDTIAAEFRLKSSRAREGWNQVLAVWIDPFFHDSVLTLELVNETRYHHLSLYPGKKIGQIFFHAVSKPDVHYGLKGRYNGDRVVMASKG